MKINVNFLNFFSENEIEKMAIETGFVIRKSPITGFNFLLTFTLGFANTEEGTLTQLASFLNNTCNINVSPQAIDERLTEKSKIFLKFCFQHALQLSVKKINIPNEFISCLSHIYIMDSTNIELHPSLKEIFKGNGGDASIASMRIQFIFDYLSGETHVEIGDVKTSDSPSLERIIDNGIVDIKGNALFMQDLGYFKTETFIKIVNSNNFFISKLKYKVKIHDLNGNEIDLLKIIKKKPEIIDIVVTIGDLRCRLLGQKLSDEILNNKLRKAYKDAKNNGNKITKEYKLFLSYGFYITNLPINYSYRIIYTIYRIRWQIELIFKTWKSILKIHKINSERENRVLCQVYGKLIFAVITTGITYNLKSNLNDHLSYFKILKYFKSVSFNWALAIIAGQSKYILFMKKLSKQLIRFCTKNKQKNKPLIDELIISLSNSAICEFS